jgi:hypothetical protein
VIPHGNAGDPFHSSGLDAAHQRSTSRMVSDMLGEVVLQSRTTTAGETAVYGHAEATAVLD